MQGTVDSGMVRDIIFCKTIYNWPLGVKLQIRGYAPRSGFGVYYVA